MTDPVDNCELVSNANQADNDRDDQGDICDADDDNDGIPDEADVCPLHPDPNQANSDGDSQGDACDLDDDNDGIPDTSDTCQFVANPDQANFDGDAQGDACDPDQDNDGVGNDGDYCPSSPLGLLVNGSGCTGEQLVALICKREIFKQHGQYVKCVTLVASAAQQQGLLSRRERNALVREAAQGG